MASEQSKGHFSSEKWPLDVVGPAKRGLSTVQSGAYAVGSGQRRLCSSRRVRNARVPRAMTKAKAPAMIATQ